MKRLILLLLFVGALLGLPLVSEAQIGENDSSAEYIAIQCAISSGNLASDYLEYGHSLAKTLSLLDPAQQERIFGSIPQPGGKSSATGKASGASTDSTAEAGSAPTTNPLIDAVGALNKLLTGGESDAIAIIGGTAPDTSVDTAPTTDPLTSEGTTSNPVPKWINSVLGYLRAIGQDVMAAAVESDFWAAVDAGIIDADGNLPTDANGNELDPDGNIIDPSAGTKLKGRKP